MTFTLNVLDKALARFLEHDLILVYKGETSLDKLRSAAQTLLSYWPILSGRLNAKRSKILQTDPGDAIWEFWQGKALTRCLNDFVDLHHQNDAVQTVDFTRVERLLHTKFRHKKMRQAVVTIRTVALLDGTIIRFKVQHPFGDAEAMLRVAQAYCSVLDGELPPQPSDFRPPISLKEEVQEKAAEISIWDKGKQIARLHDETFRASWFAGFGRTSRQRLRNLVHRSSRRVNRTIHIPQQQIDKWLAEARRREAKVTVHDLVLAFIHQQTGRAPSDPKFFGIVMNIQRQLEFEASFGNPWLMIPVQPRDPAGPVNQSDVSALVDRAMHIRHTISAARRPHCVAPIIEQHYRINGRPFVPRGFASRTPQPIVSSWANHSLWDLEIHGKKPVLTQASISFYGLMRSLGFILDDVLVVWKGNGDDDGFWVQGHLANRVWMDMEEKLSVVEAVEESKEQPPEQQEDT